MNQDKRAWVYCRIDAPEDTHEALKSQRQQLMDYADQMGFTVVGSSTDTGNSGALGCSGLTLAKQATSAHKIQVLLLNGLPNFGEAAINVLPILRAIEQSGVAVYSPLQGRIRINICKGGSQ